VRGLGTSSNRLPELIQEGSFIEAASPTQEVVVLESTQHLQQAICILSFMTVENLNGDWRRVKRAE
jgi:hypothetical protein